MQIEASPPKSAAPEYIPGGPLLQSSHAFRQTNTRLPGGNRITGIRQFDIADPTSQGVAGIIHFIGGFTGSVDPHCLDFDAWRGMTPKKRLQHHVSDADMENAAANYNCAGIPEKRPWHGGLPSQIKP